MRDVALARMISQTNAPVLVTSKQHLESLDQIRDSIPHIKTLIMTEGKSDAEQMFPQLEVLAFDDVLSDETRHIESQEKDTDLATILFTSGTTGVSKGCMLSHRYAVRTAENMIEPYRVTKDDCVYSPYPLSHDMVDTHTWYFVQTCSYVPFFPLF